MPKVAYEEFTKSSVSSVLRLVEELKAAETKKGNKADFVFRGQSTDDELLPRITRLKPKGTLLAVEQLMLEEFERQMLPFAEFTPQDKWDLLALAQHHRLPTRLLDWSYSALAALWFCVHQGPKKDEHGNLLNGVVWVLKSISDDFIKFPTSEDPFSQKKTRIFRPRVVSKRIMAQAGLFTCHRQTSKGQFIPLERNSNYKGRMVKITIPAGRFLTIREQLYASGVTDVALFPDLEGLSRHLETRYFHLRKR